MSDQTRLTTLKASPHLVKQHGGCCGFAATLMALCIHVQSEMDAIYRTISQGARYQGIEKSIQVQARIQKRIDGQLLDPTADNYLDARLSIGLMILLKEYLKETGKEDIWDGCSKYSELFTDWQYGGKLRELPDITTASAEYPFSYKHGDLALTVYALRWLLTMVGFGLVDGDSLITNDDLKGRKHALGSLTGHATLTEGLRGLVSYVDRGIYAGGIIGVAKEAFIGEDAHEPYEYIAHWVYLPAQSGHLGDVWDAEVWTWGGKTTLRALLAHTRKYVPKVGLVYKLPGTGTQFA